MRKNPIYANVEEWRCGDLMEEINDNKITGVSGGTFSPVIGYGMNRLASLVVGNKGKICTWTIECQTNCG